ncbi:MAG TPA: hypothetical protein VM450_03480 [Thermomicrobiales bacterium]|nr:hypothetical protein [Thermomicrobiales bacterium]
MAAGLEAWRGGTPFALAGYAAAGDTPAAWDRLYQTLWAMYTGDMFSPIWKQQNPAYGRDLLYSETRLMYSHVQSVGSFYETHVYLGNLSTDGKRLPDGSRGAIPLDPQTGADATDAQLLAAVATLWNRWNWQQGMSQRPLYGAILGVAFTELIDDPKRHAVWPKMIWPGYVVDLDLDLVGNVKSYALEYPVTMEIDGQEKTFRYRKEVDGAEYRYFKDDKPWDHAAGHGDAVQPNPYGFVPAIWDQHRKVNGDRGLPAMAGTRQALDQLNSILSHAFDYQNKAFGAPIGVRGGAGGGDKTTKQGPKWLNMIGLEMGGGFEFVPFDIGKTLEIVEWMKTGITEANPEARFYHELRSMSQLTGPAAEIALGDATNRVKQARKGYDPQSVKLFQMAVAMCGFRLNTTKDWTNPTKRDAAFAPYDLSSYVNGDLDMTILGRGVIEQTEKERLELERMRQEITTVAGLVATGMDETDAKARIAEQEATALRRADIF